MTSDDGGVRRVLMTADTVGGVWTYALELTRPLVARGLHVTVATMGDPLRPDQREQAAAIPGLRVADGAFRLEWMADPWDDVARAGDWLLALAERDAPDVVHLNGYAHAALPWRVPRVVVAHSCVLSWWRAVHGCDAPAAWDRYRREVARGLRAADAVVAPTRAMLRALRECHGLASGGAVIPNGVDPAAFRPVERREPFVLAAGRLWDEAKNLAALEAAAPRLPWPIYVAGDGRAPRGGAAGGEPAVRCLGRLGSAALRGWMQRAAVYALPAKYEPFGLSALEAALSGCALVLGDVASLREVWGDAALYVAPDDVGELVRAIGRLADDAGLRRRAAAAARARAVTFTAERMARGYLALYRGLAARASLDGTVSRCV